MTRYVGAIDQGTTSTRFIVFDRGGNIITSAQKEHRQIFPKPGWVEHDPVEIWLNTQEVAGAALARAGLAPGDLAAVGITNQRETTIIWDKNSGMPLHNALVWQDTRVDQLVAQYVKNGGPDRFRAKTGLPLASYFSGLKVQWLLDNVPNARREAQSGNLLFGNIDTWLLWNLTGGPHGGLHLTDVTNASRTQLMNLATLAWDDDLLQQFHIPREVLPRIVASSQVYGEAKVQALMGTPIAGILGDQQAALVGQACFRPGEVKNTYGTGCFLLMNTGEKPIASKAGLITTVAYQIAKEPARYALEGSIAIAGALVQWLRDNLGLIGNSNEVEKLASDAEDNGGVYFVPAFSGLYAPHWNERARGAILGLTRYVTRSHIGRAVLEATAFQTREVLSAMTKDSSINIPELRVDGGMVVNELLMQFQADILGIPVVRPKITETTTLGAAYAAGLAVGYWRNREDLVANWAVDKRWTPKMKDTERAALFGSWQKAVGRSLDWVDPS
jgi:glycerol kinase